MQTARAATVPRNAPQVTDVIRLPSLADGDATNFACHASTCRNANGFFL